MKTIQRIAALMLALLLCLSVALPALADAHNETQAYGASVVLVTCESSAGTRKSTGLVVGSLTDPSQMVVLVHPWVVNNQDETVVTVTTAKKAYKNNPCKKLTDNVAVIIPQEVYGSVSPLILQSSINVPTGSKVMQLYNTGSKAVFAHNGNYMGVDPEGNPYGTFEADDINRLQGDPWKSLGSAIVYSGNDGFNYLLGSVISVSPANSAIYYLDSLSLAYLLEAVNFTSYAKAADFPSLNTTVPNVPVEIPDVPVTEPSGEEGTVKTFDIASELQERDRSLSSKQLTQTIILVVAGVVILAAVVAIVLLVLRRNKGGSAAGKSTKGAKGAAYKLVGLTGPLSGQEFALTSTLTLGRSSSCNIVFSNNAAGVSGKHCEVTLRGGVVYLKDLGSSYGTLDNNSKKIPVNEPVILRKGESFFLGSKENGFMLR